MTSMGPVMLVTDVVLFVAPLTGAWLIPNQRVFVNGVPTIGQTSVGTVNVFGTQFPMTVVQTDGRVFAM